MANENISARFGQWLRNKVVKDHSYSTVGRQSGLNPTTVSDICNNNRNVRLTTFVALAKAFGEDPSALLKELSQ